MRRQDVSLDQKVRELEDGPAGGQVYPQNLRYSPSEQFSEEALGGHSLLPCDKLRVYAMAARHGLVHVMTT